MRGLGVVELGPVEVGVRELDREEDRHGGDVADAAEDRDGCRGCSHGLRQAASAPGTGLFQELHNFLSVQKGCINHQQRVRLSATHTDATRRIIASDNVRL